MNPEQASLGWPQGVYNPIKKYHTKPYDAISPDLPALSAKGKSVLITGGASGIGLAITNAFATACASHITIIGRTLESLESVKKSIDGSTSGTKVSIYAASLTDHASVQEMFAKERKAYGEFDIMVLCAGYLQSISNAINTTPNDYATSFDLNLHANIHAVQQYLAVPSTPQKPKTIVEISTLVAHSPSPFFPLYGLTKTAMSIYAKQLDLEFCNQGLRVHSVHPGTVYTGMPLRAGLKQTDLAFDHVDLPGQFVLWVTSPEAEFLKGRFVWAAWDVDELKSLKGLVKANPEMFTLGLITK